METATTQKGLTREDALDIIATHARRLTLAVGGSFSPEGGEVEDLHETAERAWKRLSEAGGRAVGPVSDLLYSAAYRCAVIAAATSVEGPWRNDPDIWNGLHVIVRQVQDLTEGEEDAP